MAKVVRPAVFLAALIWIIPISIGFGSKPVSATANRFGASNRLGNSSRLDFCACTVCIQNDSSVLYSAPSCGDYEYWSLGWSDDNGVQCLYPDCGASGEDEASTACNPTTPIGMPPTFQICKNLGTIEDPDYECSVSQTTKLPPAPNFFYDDCGDLYWDVYSEVDEGPGGTAPGNCTDNGCTTTDAFGSSLAEEELGPEGFCNSFDCSGPAAARRSGLSPHSAMSSQSWVLYVQSMRAWIQSVI